MRRDAPRRYRLYKYPDARPEGLDPLSKPPRSGYTPEMRALCKKYRYKGPPVLHQCPVCKSPVKKQLMYARGWAAADQYIVSAHICIGTVANKMPVFKKLWQP